MSPILKLGRNCYVQSTAEQSALLIDGEIYYETFYRAAELAQRSILMCGWQFDTMVRLLRGQAAEQSNKPLEFIQFLDYLCQARPELRIYVLAWDYSFVYALEREWMQAFKFKLKTSDRLHFEYDAHPATGGSHHQKFVIIDGALAFTGGMDVCESRWDDRKHEADNPLRVDHQGAPYKAYHEVQAALVGPVAGVLTELFQERWQRASDERLALSPASAEDFARFDLNALSQGRAVAVDSQYVALSRTSADERAGPQIVREIRALHHDAIRAAERLIYIETQYFTSRSIGKALIDRFSDRGRPKLQVLLLMPNDADTPKERFALGDSQDAVLATILEAAAFTGHDVRLLHTVARDARGNERATFIHSKVLIVDDRLLSVGSANLTNRSMGLDSELNVTWECAPEDDRLGRCITRVRASLLAEHVGGLPAEELEPVPGLTERLDALLASGETRLRRRLVRPPENLDPLLCAVFDPDGPELFSDEAYGETEETLFARGIGSLWARLGKADAPKD
jgi:phosphatidylserine/phosphatidylglycerophosphate/cardiolipin synthase-like enzyme